MAFFPPLFQSYDEIVSFFHKHPDETIAEELKKTRYYLYPKHLATLRDLQCQFYTYHKTTKEIKTLINFAKTPVCKMFCLSPVMDVFIELLSPKDIKKISQLSSAFHVVAKEMIAAIAQEFRPLMKIVEKPRQAVVFAQERGLRTINLKGFNIRNSHLNNLNESLTVKRLIINSGLITDSGIEFASKAFRNLIYLDLSNCGNIGNASLEAVGKLNRLTHLNLCGCWLITDVGIKNITKLTKLNYLNISFCKKITDASLFEIAKLKELTHLILEMDWDPIFRIKGGLSAISQLPLTHLNLSRCLFVSDKQLDILAQLRDLVYLNLRGYGIIPYPKNFKSIIKKLKKLEVIVL